MNTAFSPMARGRYQGSLEVPESRIGSAMRTITFETTLTAKGSNANPIARFAAGLSGRVSGIGS